MAKPTVAAPADKLKLFEALVASIWKSATFASGPSSRRPRRERIRFPDKKLRNIGSTNGPVFGPRLDV